MTWNPIETIPHAKFVNLYSRDYHNGPGKEKNGIMQGYCHHATEKLPMRFFDDFSVPVNWNFSHWSPLLEPPTE
jgi:hypothetical protein